MVSICPHNRRDPVPFDSRCYRCDGAWKLLRMTDSERAALAEWTRGLLVVKCRNCGIVSMATRVAGERSLVAFG
jgi:hypothetical protein